jgi:cbb3-type cytochrome oxidase subunit 1
MPPDMGRALWVVRVRQVATLHTLRFDQISYIISPIAGPHSGIKQVNDLSAYILRGVRARLPAREG